MPMPKITYSVVPLAFNFASLKIPQTFLPFIKISLTHFIWALVSVKASITVLTATAAAGVIKRFSFGEKSGRKIILK